MHQQDVVQESCKEEWVSWICWEARLARNENKETGVDLIVELWQREPKRLSRPEPRQLVTGFHRFLLWFHAAAYPAGAFCLPPVPQQTPPHPWAERPALLAS